MSDVMERTDAADRRLDTLSEHTNVIRAIEPAVADHLSLLLPLDRAWHCRQAERYERLAERTAAALAKRPFRAFSWIRDRQV